MSRSSLKEALATRIGGKEDGGGDEAHKGPSHFQNSTMAISMNQDIWGAELENVNAQVPNFIEPHALQEVLASARASQKKERSQRGTRDGERREKWKFSWKTRLPRWSVSLSMPTAG